MTSIIIGGGAAGFFAAIKCAECNPNREIILLEKTRQTLAKVRISGGGRCNVTHACFDPKKLITNYPRGSKELLGPFTRFQPRDTIEWFEKRGVLLKTEEDGRMFPITDSSETIIQCLLQEANKVGVKVRLECSVQTLQKQKEDNQFAVTLANGEKLLCQSVLVATGSMPKMFPILEELGHTIDPPVPSLFTFNVPSSPLLDLTGISVEKVHLKIPEIGLDQIGPILMTHWGFSGPAVLKLSAWGARELNKLDYRATLVINWLPDLSEEDIKARLTEQRNKFPAKQIGTESIFELPKQLWRKILEMADISVEQRLSVLAKKQIQHLVDVLVGNKFLIEGKTTYKQEFVTCGGVDLAEVNFKTMESKICLGLHFAGEVLNIDGITGGFNFQNAWTTGWIAGQSM